MCYCSWSLLLSIAADRRHLECWGLKKVGRKLASVATDNEGEEQRDWKSCHAKRLLLHSPSRLLDFIATSSACPSRIPSLCKEQACSKSLDHHAILLSRPWLCAHLSTSAQIHPVVDEGLDSMSSLASNAAVLNCRLKEFSTRNSRASGIVKE